VRLPTAPAKPEAGGTFLAHETYSVVKDMGLAE
jgi:hypothetical protein